MPLISSVAGLPTVTSPMPSAPGVVHPRSVSSATVTVPSTADTVASIMTNLLPISSFNAPAAATGVYVGEGLPPVPQHIAKKILNWKYVDMAELLPEFWADPKCEEDASKRSQPRRARQVTEITTWIQCYACYVSVLATKFPEAVPELMAYLVTISRVSQDFAGVAWVRYDAAFRRQAAISGNRKWSQINPSLYSLSFTGKAQIVTRCDLCFSTSHATGQCALTSDPDPELPTRIKAVEAAVVSLAARRTSLQNDRQLPLTQVCRLWNTGRCRFPKCRYKHECSRCSGDHPSMSCARPPSAKLPATEPPRGNGYREYPR